MFERIANITLGQIATFLVFAVGLLFALAVLVALVSEVAWLGGWWVAVVLLPGLLLAVWALLSRER